MKTTLQVLSFGVRNVRPSSEAWASRFPLFVHSQFGRGSKLQPEAAGSLQAGEALVQEGVLRAIDKC